MRVRLRRPTIADVARQAGVSNGAVSFAVNGRPGVAEATRERVLAVAAELGWHPSQRARSLSVSRAFAVGMVIARPPELIGGDPFFPAFIAGVETVLAEHGQALVMQVVPHYEAEADGYRRLARDGRVDGVFLSDLRETDPRISLLEGLHLPAVTLGRPDVPSPFPAVVLDDRPGIAEAVRHLADLGHRRLAHVAGPREFLHGHSRRAAFESTVAGMGLRPGPVVVSDFSAAGGGTATRALLGADEPPTAIVYANDLMAIAGLAVAHELGFDVPRRLSITGFDDTELAAHVRPALTTVKADAFGWGQAASRALLALVEEGQAPNVDLGPSELVIRDSTAAPLPRRRRSRPAPSTTPIPPPRETP